MLSDGPHKQFQEGCGSLDCVTDGKSAAAELTEPVLSGSAVMRNGDFCLVTEKRRRADTL
jgi:hypothetical protein